VPDDVGEARQAFRMDFDVIAVRPARERPARLALRLREQHADILPEPLDPAAFEGALAGDDAVAIDPAHDGGFVVGFGGVGGGGGAHGGLLSYACFQARSC
jgi:hypothetical protein